nr:MAG TPA: hypothetical protein [Caudoviricetes sp.]
MLYSDLFIKCRIFRFYDTFDTHFVVKMSSKILINTE